MMNDYSELFKEDMNGLELQIAYVNEYSECVTEEDKKHLCDICEPIRRKVFEREMAQENVLTAY